MSAPSSSSFSSEETGAPAAPWSPTAPSSTPAAGTTSEAPWIPSRTSGSVTVETVTYSFNFLVEPPPRPEKDGKSSSEQVHVDFLAVVPKMKSAASIFDGLGSAFKTFSSAVHAPGATDKSVSTAGSGLLGLFHKGFSAAADIGGTLGAIGLSEIDKGGKLLNRFKQTSLDIFDLGGTIKDIEPLLGSNLNLANGNKLLTYSDAITKGIGIGEGLKDLTDLANEVSDATPTPDTTPTPESTNVQSTPEPTTQTTPTTSLSSSSTGSSTSSSASPTETTKLWSIATKAGTSLAAFDAFVNTLPDAGTGMKIVYPYINYQVYGTYMTEADANLARTHPLVDTVMGSSFVDDPDDDGYSVIPRTLEKRVDPERYPEVDLNFQPTSPSHLNLISQGPVNAQARLAQPATPMPDYLLSPKAGEGITIFVIDTGISPFHEDFKLSYDPKDFYCVPNNLMGLPATMPGEGNKQVMYVPDSDKLMKDSRNHGSCVASLATGKIYGVAKKAHLVPVRYKNSRGAAHPLAIEDAFMYVISRVSKTDKGENGPKPRPGWAVLNFSQGFSHLKGQDWTDRKALMEKLFWLCWENDIVTVIAAGNSGEFPNFDLSKDIPACLGRTDNPLITVGASNLAGLRWPQTNRDIGLGGSITTSAQGDEVRCVHDGPVGSQKLPGTSMAAPQIAGLAAYFMSLSPEELPEGADARASVPGTGGPLPGPMVSNGFFMVPDLHVKGMVSQTVKDYIARMSYKRNPTNVEAVSVAYNGAEDGLCPHVGNNAFKRKRKREGVVLNKREEGDLVPVVVDGVLNLEAGYPMTCPLPSSSSSVASSSTSSLASTSSSATRASSTAPSSASSLSSTSSPAQAPTTTKAADSAEAMEGAAPSSATPSTTTSRKADEYELPCYKCSDGDVMGMG